MAGVEHRVCDASDLAEGAMRPVELDGRKLLLARVDGACHAIGGTCPHAGGPLAEGVLHGGVVICPWHKAAFRIATGARVEPPAVDDLPAFPVRVVDGRVLVTVDDEPERVDPAPMVGGADRRCFAIVGAGAAGAVAAQVLREEGFAGRVVLISREDRLPYDRTVLSKYALSGTQGGEKSPLQDEAFYARHGIERMAREVARLDAASRTITFADGTALAYDAALVATGGTPRPFKVPGAELANVFLLRVAADAERIAAVAAGARRAVVAGAGFIAVEAAASLRERGLEVTVVAPTAAPFERQLGTEIGNAFRRLHERKGVAFRLGQEIAAVEGDGRVREVVLRDGSRLPADLIVAGLGIAPATDFLRDVERREDGGVAVDARLRAAEALFAAGDIAAFPLRGDGPAVRVEHWRVAEQHGRVAALNMLGRGASYDAVPYFWTIHFKKRLDYVGHAAPGDEVVVDGDLERPEFIACYLRDGRVTAVAGWDRDRQMAAAIHLMTERRDWTRAGLCDALRGWA